MAGPPRQPLPDRPALLPGAARRAAARRGRGVGRRRRARRSGPVRGVHPRPARPRSRRSPWDEATSACDPHHPRLTPRGGCRRRTPRWPARSTALAEATGDALVFLALGRDRRVVAAFEHYAPLVDGRWLRRGREHGGQRPPGRLRASAPGPLEAVFQLLARHRDFVPDHDLERYTVTFNRSGYLRRVEPR